MDYRRLEATLQAQLGPHAAVACCSADGDVSTLAPEEYPAVARAIAQRRKEFAAGRTAARNALQRLGRPAVPIPVQPDRSPKWPEGIIGSISHAGATCVSVVALKPHWNAVGIDVESDTGLPRELWDSICIPNEIQRASTLPETVQARWMMRIFSAKEAYYKWVYPQTRRILEFHDVEITMDNTLESTEFRVRPLFAPSNGLRLDPIEGSLTVEQDLIINLVIR